MPEDNRHWFSRKAKKRPHSILILTGGRADLALQPPHSRNLPIERLRRVSKDQRICSSLATLSPACSRLCWRSTPNRSASAMCSRSGIDRIQRNFAPIQKQVGARFEL